MEKRRKKKEENEVKEEIGMKAKMKASIENI
jgi:hypothetical protein